MAHSVDCMFPSKNFRIDNVVTSEVNREMVFSVWKALYFIFCRF